ncbi:ATP phosphoribosyltransferase [Nocardia asiatica]|uniref:ATP phosphoribosyltransferase n=1 Tax=Nocardia asiatica TaxID=209252 RepID=UPI0002E3E187|nr:ATP phosphoribosyltransferase [Nocardia asiatica]
MIRLALPKGRLAADSARLLSSLGAGEPSHERRYAFRHRRLPLEILLLKSSDIPRVVSDGYADFAVVGDEWLIERGGDLVPMTPLCWYHARICVLAPADMACPFSSPPRSRNQAWTVATPYPAIAARGLSSFAAVEVRQVAGAVEAYPGRVTDLAIDCVETGATIRANGLTVVRELLRCDVRLVRGRDADTDTEVARRIIAAVEDCAVHSSCTYSDADSFAGRKG